MRLIKGFAKQFIYNKFVSTLMTDTQGRVKKVFDRCEEELDAIVIQNGADVFIDPTFFYLTGLRKGIFESSTVVALPDGNLEVVTSRLEEESARKGDFPVSVYQTRDQRLDVVKGSLLGLKKVGMNSTGITLKSYQELKKCAPDAEFVDVSEAVVAARLVKDREEIELLRTACKIASDVALEIPNLMEEGVKEYEVAAEMNYRMMKRGAQGTAFDTLVASGPNAAEPHYTSGDRQLKKGECLLCDFGALKDRYRSDITRTYFLGKPDDKLRDIYETTKDAQQACLDFIKAGVKGGDAHNLAADIINKKYDGKFTHSLGHSLGLATHDGSVLHPIKDLTLEENMVFTVEPGIYIPGFGGVRIEDDIVVTKDGCEVLTPATKDITIC